MAVGGGWGKDDRKQNTGTLALLPDLFWREMEYCRKSYVRYLIYKIDSPDVRYRYLMCTIDSPDVRYQFLMSTIDSPDVSTWLRNQCRDNASAIRASTPLAADRYRTAQSKTNSTLYVLIHGNVWNKGKNKRYFYKERKATYKDFPHCFAVEKNHFSSCIRSITKSL